MLCGEATVRRQRGEAAVRRRLGGFFRAQARAAAEVLLGEVAKARSGAGRNRGDSARHEGGDEGLVERGEESRRHCWSGA
jgi:hypothetical protein